jgi:PRC-barrel domain
MAPDRTVVQCGEERSLTAQGKGEPHEPHPTGVHPAPPSPQRELRQRGVFDSGDRLIGHVENIYVDEEENFRFVDVAMGFGKKHHLVPVEAIAEEEPGSITLTVEQQTVQSAPTLGDPHDVPDEGLQRAAREHCGLAALPPEP